MAAPSRTKDALELNRLAGGLTTASGLYFVCLARIPYSFTYSEDPLALEPLTTLCVASVSTWMFSLYTSSRLRGWWRQDYNEQLEASQQKDQGDGTEQVEAPMVDVDRSERTFVPLINALLVPLAATPFLALAAFLLGAPFTYKAPATLLACLYISILALTPSGMALPAPWSSQLSLLVWIRIFSAARPKTRTESALMVQAWSTILGAILGAIPTALDWGRMWQFVLGSSGILRAIDQGLSHRTWPVTICWGAFYGNMIGAMAACLVAGLPETSTKPKVKATEAKAAVTASKSKAGAKKR